MKKDIPQKKVENVAICIVPRGEEVLEGEPELWDVYILNLKEEAIQGVMVTTQGYGQLNGQDIKTSTLRHFFTDIPGQTAKLIEPIQTKVFDLTNQYWVSFKYNDFLYDKKYIFVRGSIDPSLFTQIPLLDKMGVMIK